jgi:type II secretory pathway pseudopilin PulG
MNPTSASTFPSAPPPRRPRPAHRRAFTLLEAVMVVLVLAIAVPPTLVFFQSRANQHADAISALRATTLAQSVMEHVLADASSNTPALGYDAFANITTYLDTPATGLRARLTTLSAPYDAAGIDWSVAFSVPVASNGVASGVPADNLFRIATVTVTAPRSDGGSINVQISSLVTDL